MGWATCLPAICMSNTSIGISQRTSQLFEEKPFSKNNNQSLSVFEFCGNRHEKSSKKISSFMCDYCEYSSESKLNIFEHFIKNHVFLCTLCSYAGVSRSSILRHCLQSHESIMKEKLENMKSYEVNIDKLFPELGVSSKGFNHFHKSSGANHLHCKSDCSSDDEISKSSFLSKNHKQSKSKSSLMMSTDADSDVENEMEASIYPKRKFRPIPSLSSRRFEYDFPNPYHKMDSDNHQAESSDKIVHFLDEATSPRKSPRMEEDYNEFSDSSQMDLFFSTEGNENDPDMGESIFHDHQEMFMVTRLPFPIRQDDSPNEMSTVVPEPPSILQTILQGDKQDPVDGPSSASPNLPYEKAYVTTNIPQSVSPGLSLPSGETLQKQFEAVIPKSSAFNCNDIESQDTAEFKGNQSTTDKLLRSSKESIEIDDLASAKDGSFNKISTESSQNGPNIVDNFLLPPSSDEKEKDKNDKTIVKHEETDNKKRKFVLLRNLLKEKPASGSQKAAEKTAVMKSAPESSFQAPTSIKNASNMTLLELLSTDTPFPLRPTRPEAKKDNSKDSSDCQPPASITLVCNVCKQTFHDQNIFDSHVKICSVDKHHPPSRDLSKSLQRRQKGSSVNIFHSSLSHHVQSSLRTDNFTASKMLSKFSENHIKLTLNSKIVPSTLTSNKLFKKGNNKRFHGESISRGGLKHRRLRMKNSLALKPQSKQGNHSRGHSVMPPVSDGSVVKRIKRKAEQDNDYDPESESSESSDNLAVDSLKQRKKTKRPRKHLSSSLRSPRMKIPSAVNLMSKLCEKALNNASENTQLSLSLSSSLSSSFSSSLSSSLSQASTVETDNVKSGQERSLPAYRGSSDGQSNVEEKDKLGPSKMTALNCALQRDEAEMHLPSKKSVEDEIKQEPVSQDEGNDLQTSPVIQTFPDRKASLDPDSHFRGSSQTLLHHLLSLPTEAVNTSIGQQNSASTSSQACSELKLEMMGVENCDEKRSMANTNILPERNSLPIIRSLGGSFFEGKQQQHGDPSNLFIAGQSPPKQGKLFRNRSRSHSLTESDFSSRKLCEEIKNPCHTSRLSASMMDIPDPPSPTSANKDHIVKPPALPCLSQLSPPSGSQLFGAISSPSHEMVQLVTPSTQSAVQASSASISSPHSASSDSVTNLGPSTGVSTPHSSLLRNLLTQQLTKAVNIDSK